MEALMDINRTIENLKAHGFTVTFFETGEAAARHIVSECAGKSCGFGGSQTVDALGLYEKLKEKNCPVYWHRKIPGQETYGAAASAQVYFSSANAISQSGEIVNIDGFGNRLASTLYGHEKLYIVAGVNKICEDLESAIWRARNIASPLNARRLNKKTPCAMGKELKCYDCRSPERICRGLLIMLEPVTSIRNTEVVLINEELGF